MTGTVDGRTARRDRNRNEVVEAALALVEEGVVDPSVDQLTARSGLSARSIFRYFEGLDDLRRAVIRSHFERLRPLLEAPDAGEGDLDSRIKRFVDSRLKFNEAAAGPARTAQVRAHVAPFIAEDIQAFRQVLDASVRRHFAPELKARGRAEAEDLTILINVLVSFEGWDLMVRDHQRSRAQIRRAWTLALHSLLTR
ncbi:MAG: TetR/AcrR family transcriptional regulator [Acidobacteriota bacterium]|nr:TetR/AcrR family transcriptional regulator [Acidobacteriota bacterium]